MTAIDLREISFNSYLTDGEYFPQLNRHVLDEVYEVGTAAYQAELSNRTPEEIEYLMGGWRNFGGRLAQPAVGMTDGRLLPDQSFANPSLTVAYSNFGSKDMRIVGWSYSADNVSGATEAIRHAKRLSIVKNYRWLKNVVVLPDFQGRGIGTTLSAIQLAKARSLQPASAYTWPGEGHAAGTRLVVKSLGMEPTEEPYPRDIYGTGEMVQQQRFAAKRARAVVRRAVELGVPLKVVENETIRDLARNEKDTLFFLANHQK